jgi:hypothetical protein
MSFQNLELGDHDNSSDETIRPSHVWGTHQPTFGYSLKVERERERERELVGEESILHSQLSLTPCHDS